MLTDSFQNDNADEYLNKFLDAYPILESGKSLLTI